MTARLRLVRTQSAPQAAVSPVALYLARLSPGASRDGCRYVLQEIAPLLGARTPEAVNWAAVRYPDAVHLLQALEAKRLSVASRRKARMCLRGVLKECWRLGWMSADDLARATDTAAPHGEVLPAGRALTRAELVALWQAALSDVSVRGKRTAVILALLYATGMRRGELIHLEVRDYDAASGALTIRHGKAGRQRLAWVGDPAIRSVVAAWLAVRGPAPGWLLCAVGRSGDVRVCSQPMHGRSIWQIVRELSQRAGLAPVTPHDLRRTVATVLADRVPLDLVRQYLGHAEITTTSRYVRRDAGVVRHVADFLTIPKGD